MRNPLRAAALALAVPGLMATSLPVAAATYSHAPSVFSQADTWQDHGGRHRSYQSGRGYYGQSAYAEPVYAGTPVWRGDDGRYYCRKKNGTTGLIIGGAAGALLGREIAGRGSNTMGMILGGAAGALLGRHIDRNNSGSRCR